MIADRRRRVRQAALDTMAVLGQIYDPEVYIARRACEIPMTSSSEAARHYFGNRILPGLISKKILFISTSKSAY